MSRQQIVQSNPHPTASKQINKPAVNSISDETSLADTSITKPLDYKISFSPDIILSTVGVSSFFGVQGVTQMLFSDMLVSRDLRNV